MDAHTCRSAQCSSCILQILPPDGNPLACRSMSHDVCVVTPDGRHHTVDRWHRDKGVTISGG